MNINVLNKNTNTFKRRINDIYIHLCGGVMGNVLGIVGR